MFPSNGSIHAFANINASCGTITRHHKNIVRRLTLGCDFHCEGSPVINFLFSPLLSQFSSSATKITSPNRHFSSLLCFVSSCLFPFRSNLGRGGFPVKASRPSTHPGVTLPPSCLEHQQGLLVLRPQPWPQSRAGLLLPLALQAAAEHSVARDRRSEVIIGRTVRVKDLYFLVGMSRSPVVVPLEDHQQHQLRRRRL